MRKINLLLSVLFVFTLCFGNIMAQNKQLEEFKYVSPQPNAKYIHPQSTIIFSHGEALSPSTLNGDIIKVSGSLSGELPGGLKLSKDSHTLIFKSNQVFQYNETITVQALGGIQTSSGIEISPMEFSFNTMKEDNTYLRDKFVNWMNENYINDYGVQNASNNIPTGIKSTMNLPEDYPPYAVTIINNPAPGYIFLNPHNVMQPLNHPAYSVIMDHYGTPVYYHRNPAHTLDLKIQKTGVISEFIAESAAGLGIGYGTFHTYDNSMNMIKAFQMGNGHMAEMHDFQLFDDGSYYLFTYDPQLVDMSLIVEGGDPEATVMGAIIQELDADDNVVFEWSSWDHMPITNATPDVDLTGIFIDYCHINAVEKDNDGNILASFRNTDEIMKISRETGDIIWRLNSASDDLNDFTFTNDTIKFSHQHDIRRLENGNITIFDNGNLHNPPYTRLCEYELDEENMTAELVWVYPPEYVPGSIFAFATGSAQRIPNGNTAVGWGVNFYPIPMAGEVTSQHEITWEAWGIDSITTYRARKHLWETDIFELSKDTIDWGEFTGYTPEPYILQVTNNYGEAINISGSHNHNQVFYVTSTLPISIEPGATENIIINFFPTGTGYYEDVLTIMCQKDEFEMIGKQVILSGYTSDEIAPVASFTPENETTDVSRMPGMILSFDEKLYNTGGNLISSADLQDLIIFHKNEVGGEAIPFKAHITWYDNNMTSFSIQPFDFLDENTTYFWGLNENMAQDWNGNSIGNEAVASFTTGDDMGVDDMLVDNFARVYPNPTSGILNLEFLNKDLKAVSIYNIAGKEIFNAENLNALQYSFDISNQPEGIYIVRVINQMTGSSAELKVIKK